MSKKLITFPCAGGSANNFNKIIKNLDCKIYSMEYSGHWTRYEERMYASMEDCIESLYSEIEEIVTETDEIFLLGHSMGAIVAYEIAVRLLKHGFIVKTLFLLSCMPPDEMDYRKITFENNDGIKKFLNEIRQIPFKVLDSEFFERELLPSIRNDFSILSNYETMLMLSEKIDARIICISGVHDPLVQRMSGWQRYTSNICSCVECEGAHFFLDDSLNISKIRDVISRQLSKNCESKM